MKENRDVIKKIWLFAILGLILRLILMPATLHPDIWAVSFSEYLFSFKGVVNIYDYLSKLPETSLQVINYGRNFFTYPPLAYFTFGLFGWLLKPFFNQSFFNNLAGILPSVLSDNRLYWHLFLTKLPYLFFDLGILMLLLRLFNDEKKKYRAALLWIFNPLSLYTSYMIGQFDIIPVFLVILSLYLYKTGRLCWAAVCLGLGGAFKMFPLFFIPFLAVSGGKTFWTKTKLFILGITPYILTILPFMGTIAFRQNVLFSNQSQKMLFAKIPVSGAEYLSLFIVIYVFFLGFSFVKKLELWQWFLAILLLFFSVTHYHPQWFLWMSPFLIMFLVEKPKQKILPIILFVCWAVITVLFEPSLSVSLFAPIAGSLGSVRPLSETVNRFYDVFQFKSLVRSVFFGISLAMTALLFKKNETV